jgi:putative membrane protein
MKNKLIVMSAVTLGCIALAGSASALQHSYPPLHGGSDSNASPSASPKASADAKTAGKQLSSQDKSFVTNAAKGGMMEVEMGKMAAQNSQNADVKKFGNRMVADHSKANSELMALAKEEGISLPGAKSAGKWKSDKAYMDDMVKDHQTDLAEFQKEASKGTDADLKKFAAKGAKMVSSHLQMAKSIQSKLK